VPEPVADVAYSFFCPAVVRVLRLRSRDLAVELVPQCLHPVAFTADRLREDYEDGGIYSGDLVGR